MDQSSRHLINADSLQRMKHGAILINTARGPLIDEVALCDALKSGHLRAAGLDVFEKEPLTLESPLLKLENVLTCGHLGGLDHESQQGTLVMAAQVIIGLKEGRWPTECIRNLPGVRDWALVTDSMHEDEFAGIQIRPQGVLPASRIRA